MDSNNTFLYSIGKTVEFQLRALRALRGSNLPFARVFKLSRKYPDRLGFKQP